jgi:arylsulfatase A-like enzyme
MLFYPVVQLLLAFLPVPDPPAKEIDAKPNIVIILADDLGYGDLSSYGAKDIRTPHIDALLRDGMRFTNFYANSPVCSPTRAALLSGKYPDLVGVPGVIRTHADDSWGYLSPQALLLPQVLKKEGYQTALIGKWHLGLQAPNLPNLKGFDHFQGFLGDMMDDYYNHLRWNINYMRLNNQQIKPQGHATDLFSAWAVDYINNQAKLQKPFFLYLAYNAPHVPVQPPRAWLDKVKAREKGITDKRAHLIALIEHMDAGIGTVVKALKKSGAYHNTILIFSSDNGGQITAGANNGHTRDAKGSMYEGGLKVPAGVIWPGKIKPGSISEQVLLTMDIFPTLLNAAQIPFAGKTDGRSFLPTLLGQNHHYPERPVYFVRREGQEMFGGKIIEAVRLGDWKLLLNNPFSAKELYNLKNDPLENNNLKNVNAEKYQELEKLLRAQTLRRGAVPWQAPED